jgi:hypothetical protein
LKREAINRYSENTVNKLLDDKLDVKKFWSLSKSILGSKSQHCIPPLIENSRTISDDVHYAEIFNEFFSSHMRLDDTNPPPLPHFEPLCNNKLEVLETSESDVLKLLSKINIYKSSGSDGLNNIILRKCAHTLCKPFTKIFNYCLLQGVFPSKWKVSNVSPVFKNGDKQNKSNYKPIALLSSISKCLETIVFKRLYEFIIENTLLIENNSGFKRNDSTINL